MKLLNLVTGVPHASFEVPFASQAGKTRESIEIRSLVYY